MILSRTKRIPSPCFWHLLITIPNSLPEPEDDWKYIAWCEDCGEIWGHAEYRTKVMKWLGNHDSDHSTGYHLGLVTE